MPKQTPERIIDRPYASGTGSGGVLVLAGTQALNQILDDQAPQFLLKDGTRALTGNLAVDSGVTIDGVDLNVHAADASAHHAPVTVTAPIALSGQLVSLTLATDPGLENSSGLRVKMPSPSGLTRDSTGVYLADAVAGAGLTIASKVLAVGAGALISVAADSVGVTPGSNYQFVGTGAGTAAGWRNVSELAGSGLVQATGVLAVGAGADISVAADSVAVISSSDVGTTPAANVLKSTGAGGLTLASLTAKGSVDVLNGGDLTVGSNILFVDASLASIGVNRAPDPQFSVDVAGALRADYLVGRHAIQLEKALFIAHYDGPGEPGVNFFGETTAHLGQVGRPVGGAIHPRGRFNKAIQIAEATTNLCTNPSLETNTTGWVVWSAGTLARSSDYARYGLWSLKVTTSATPGASGAYFGNMAKSAGQTYTASCWVYRTESIATLDFRLMENTTTIGSAVTLPQARGWHFVSVTGTTATGATDLRALVRRASGSTVFDFYVDALQVELKAYPTPYCDGSLGGYSAGGVANGTGHSWSGTAHASTSSRLAGNLTYANVAVASSKLMTCMAWVWIAADTDTLSSNWLYIAWSGSHYYALTHIFSDRVRLVYNAGAGSVTVADSSVGSIAPGMWNHICFTIDGANAALYVNGVADGTGTIATAPTPTNGAATLYVGAQADGSFRLNGLIEDLVITSEPIAAETVSAIYESDAPVFAESSTFHFRATPQGLVWADDEGLWMRDTTGNPVLGAYGGEAATKSWGGATMNVGDILFGRYGAADGGWMWFDQDGVSAKPQWKWGYADKTVLLLDSGGATLDGVLDISTTGGIYQGSGSFASPTTGLKIWNVGGAGKIAGISGGVEQWYGHTDGKLYAGAGSVWLDANGLNLDVNPASSPIRFMDGANILASINQINQTSPTRYELQISAGKTSYPGQINMYAFDTSGNIKGIVGVSGAATGDAVTLSSTSGDIGIYGNANNIYMGQKVAIDQWSSTGAVPALKLSQADVSEEFIEFSGTVSSSNPISTDAVGTYYGKVRVSVNGTFKYMALYNT